MRESFPAKQTVPHHTEYLADPPEWEWVCKRCHRARHREAGDMDPQRLDVMFGRHEPLFGFRSKTPRRWPLLNGVPGTNACS